MWRKISNVSPTYKKKKKTVGFLNATNLKQRHNGIQETAGAESLISFAIGK